MSDGSEEHRDGVCPGGIHWRKGLTYVCTCVKKCVNGVCVCVKGMREGEIGVIGMMCAVDQGRGPCAEGVWVWEW